MLNRIFSRNGKSKTGQTDGQGSLLDLFDTGAGADSNVVDFSTAQPSSNSLLSAINDTEVEAERARQAAQAEHLAAQRASREALWNNPPASPAPSYRDQVKADQQEQLELLSKELDEFAQRARQRDELASVKEETPDIRETVASVAAPRSARPPSHSGASAFSFESVVSALLRGWWAIAACGLIGALLAAIYALSMPNKYLSVAEVLIEPRGIRVIENTVAPNGFNSEATVAYAESQVRILTSSSVLDPVIEDLELADDSEFNGTRQVAGLFGLLVRMIIGESDNPNERFVATKQYLYQNMYVSRINQTFTIQIGVTTEEPTKSARIANAVARGYMKAESRAKSSAARSATENLTGRLDELRAKVRMSEEKVETYKAENGLVDAEGKLVSEVQLTRLNDQLAVAQSQVSDARSRAEQASQADLSDVLSGSLPTALASPTVSQLRVQYSRAKSNLDKISTTLGPRHPERIGAEAELRSARQAIAGELSRIVESAQEDYQSARSRLAATQGQVNTLKASAVTDSAAKVKLRELEREVDANRRVYETYLIRSRETGEQENLRTESARIISEAAPAAEKDGPNRKLITAAGGVAGGGLGMLLVLVPFAFGVARDFASGVRLHPESPGQPSYDDDLYSSHATQTFGKKPDTANAPAQAAPIASIPLTEKARSKKKRSRKTKPNTQQTTVTHDELEALRREFRSHNATQAMPEAAQQAPQAAAVAQPQLQPQPLLPVQMPLFAAPSAYQSYAPPAYGVYPQPVMQPPPMVYTHPPTQPMMPQPVFVQYPVAAPAGQPQSATPSKDERG